MSDGIGTQGLAEKSEKISDYPPMRSLPGEFRCVNCNKLLARKNKEGNVAGQIKCSRCGAINEA